MTKQARLNALHRQIHRLEGRIEGLQRRSYRYSWLRITIVITGLLVAGLALFLLDVWPAAICLAVTTALFGLAVFVHRRVEASIRRHQILVRIKSAHIARALLDWERIPSTFPHQPQPKHPFEVDLDLVGERSLHRLLDTAVSYEGSLRLRDWLAAPVPDLAQIARRQQLVRELAPLSLFRDKLSLNAMAAVRARKTWEAGNLITWLDESAPHASLRLWLVLSGGLVLTNLVLLVANLVGLLPAWWQFTSILLVALWLVRSRATESMWDQTRALQGALQQLYAVFDQLETFSYSRTPALQALCRPFLDPTHRPSRYLSRITRAVAAMGLRGNPVLALVLNVLSPWDAYLAYSLNRTKSALAERAPAWMDIWFELEALSSLANLAWLNPGCAFPQVFSVENSGDRPHVFNAIDLGHPLIPDDERVCNDLTVHRLGDVAVITGSNMAGKSVFLKTVGMNLALAYAGGAVCAQRLETVLFRLFTCMGISDSITDGISYFYAEVKRLKALLSELERDHPLPLWFAIDEIFRGTNNRERLIGSRAYVRALVGRRAIGFIATHDLELATLAEELPQVRNYHFRDRVSGDRMAFDYTLRPGPCPTTNALVIMQLEGLPVPPTGTGH